MHATTFEFEQYVSDALAPEQSERLERHCDGCDSCASALAKEARLELSLRKLFAEQRCGTAVYPLPHPGEVSRSDEGASRPKPSALAPLYLLAAAACVALAFFTAHLPVHHSAAAPALTTDAGDAFQPPPGEHVIFDGDLAHGTP
jgi:anti-sigma factor RsiW